MVSERRCAHDCGPGACPPFPPSLGRSDGRLCACCRLVLVGGHLRRGAGPPTPRHLGIRGRPRGDRGREDADDTVGKELSTLSGGPPTLSAPPRELLQSPWQRPASEHQRRVLLPGEDHGISTSIPVWGTTARRGGRGRRAASGPRFGTLVEDGCSEVFAKNGPHGRTVRRGVTGDSSNGALWAVLGGCGRDTRKAVAD